MATTMQNAEEHDRRWVEEHVLRGGDLLIYGNLQEEAAGIAPEEFWAELRRVAQDYLSLGEERAGIMQQKVDSLLDDLIARDRRYGYPPPFCHKGCCACCKELVYCTGEEVDLIVRYCQQAGIAIDARKLERQLRFLEADAAGNHTGVTRWNDQDAADQTCVFLHPEDGSCRIWPVRPLVCRVHLAEGTDAYCAPHNGVPHPEVRGINYPEWSYLLTVVFTIHRDTIRQSMGRLLLQRLA